MKARKKYGQHFLENAWADKLIAAIGPSARDRFLEIGPGPGALTVRLAAAVAHVTAVEVDPEMVGALRSRVPSNVTIVHQDFLAFDLAAFARESREPLRIAGNLPYNISSPILFTLLRAHRDGAPIADATLMLQREVADRIEAKPGTKDYGTLSIFVQLRARVRRVLALPPGAFRPSPKVHSAVLRLDFHDPEATVSDEDIFERLVRSIFTERRKTLSNALRRFAEEHGLDPREAIDRAGLDGIRRPETLQLTELARLADVFSSSPA
ncbi:MAG TPA: 16S rRNA (adenine(1518)-N(6)/adenine(1519)-N(6))-dimethyltransferase RsmA [Vicinamibacterales bacterium]|jgi:16S rRNA (adenine1518-N6/adenine1519-N6)-dimethyltransferase